MRDAREPNFVQSYVGPTGARKCRHLGGIERGSRNTVVFAASLDPTPGRAARLRARRRGPARAPHLHRRPDHLRVGRLDVHAGGGLVPVRVPRRRVGTPGRRCRRHQRVPRARHRRRVWAPRRELLEPPRHLRVRGLPGGLREQGRGPALRRHQRVRGPGLVRRRGPTCTNSVGRYAGRSARPATRAPRPRVPSASTSTSARTRRSASPSATTRSARPRASRPSPTWTAPTGATPAPDRRLLDNPTQFELDCRCGGTQVGRPDDPSDPDYTGLLRCENVTDSRDFAIGDGPAVRDWRRSGGAVLLARRASTVASSTPTSAASTSARSGRTTPPPTATPSSRTTAPSWP